MRKVFAVFALGLTTACTQPSVPDSGPQSLNVNSPEYQRERDAALANPGLPSPYAISGEPSGVEIAPIVISPSQTITTVPAAPPETTNNNDDIAAQTTAALAATSSNAGTAPVVPSPSTPQPTVAGSTGISSENDFESVSGQRSIEGDAALLASNREQYEVVTPTAVPARPPGGRPNIVAYALETNNPKGVRVHNRSPLNSQSKFQRNCAKYPSADLAQEDFLRRGGPNRDRKGLDPDGDGYACSWDPTPFRTASGN